MTYEEYLIREAKRWVSETFAEGEQTRRRVVEYLRMQKHIPALEQYLAPFTAEDLERTPR